MNVIREFNFSVENYQPYFTSVDIETVKTCVVSFFRENRLTIRDLDLFSLVLHVCIALERTCDGNPIRCPLKERTQDRYRVKELLERLAAFHQISLSEDEQNYMLLLFYARLPHSGIDAICENRFEDFIYFCLSEVEKQFHIDLRGDRELIKNLSYHLYMLCERAKKHSFLKNPMTEELKIQFPIAFDMGVLMGHLLGEIFHVQPDENEIGYLTLHLLGAIERMDSVHKIKVAIVDPHGEVSARLIASRLLKSLGNKIEIVGYYSLFEIDHIRREEVDLIITTAVIIKDLGIKVENCSLAVTSLDVQRIEVRIRELETKADEHIKTDAPLFFKELFYPQMDFKEKEEVISFLCTKLYEQGFCQADYFQAVMERERIAPTSFGSCFAIPHPIRRIALKDGLAVCSLKNSIYWNGHKVRLVLLFSATENEAIFDLVYERIVVLLNHHTKVKKLSRIEDFDIFVKQFYEAQ